MREGACGQHGGIHQGGCEDDVTVSGRQLGKRGAWRKREEAEFSPTGVMNKSLLR